MRKENLISLLLFALLKCHIGYALNCYLCVGECKEAPIIKTCGSEEMCMIREMYAGGVRQGQQKGCLNSRMCNTTSPIENFKQWCCDKDLCNTEIPQPGGAIPAGANPSDNSANTPTSSLTCYACDYVCIKPSQKLCGDRQACVTKYTKVAGVSLRRYDCVNASICSTETREDVAGTTVSVTNQCCTSNLCNSAGTLRLPVLPAIGALLFLWIAKLS